MWFFWRGVNSETCARCSLVSLLFPCFFTFFPPRGWFFYENLLSLHLRFLGLLSPLIVLMETFAVSLSETCILASLAAAIGAVLIALSRVRSHSSRSLFCSSQSLTPNTIWSLINDSVRVPKLHVWLISFRSVRNSFTDSPSCCTLRQNFYLS